MIDHATIRNWIVKLASHAGNVPYILAWEVVISYIDKMYIADHEKLNYD